MLMSVYDAIREFPIVQCARKVLVWDILKNVSLGCLPLPRLGTGLRHIRGNRLVIQFPIKSGEELAL